MGGRSSASGGFFDDDFFEEKEVKDCPVKKHRRVADKKPKNPAGPKKGSGKGRSK